MLKIGIIDVTTVGSTICQRRLSQLGGETGEHPEFVVHSLPFAQYRQALNNQDWDAISKLILYSANKLHQLDVDFIIIPSNTPHYAYQQFACHSPVPILNLIKITAQVCQAKRLNKVAILGTQPTMTEGLYTQALQTQGIELVVPDEPMLSDVHHLIIHEIVPDKINESTRQHVLQQIQQLSCDGVILGCTELPEVFNTAELGKVAIDTTRLLAEISFRIAKDGDVDSINEYTE